MPKKARPISVRQRKYIKGVVAGKSKYKAAIEAGYSPNTAVAPGMNIEKPSIKDELNRALEKSGITTQSITDKVKEGMGAKKVVIFGTGDNIAIEKAEDYAVQHKYLETAIKLKGIDREVGMPAALNFFNLTKADTDKYGV